MCESIENVLNRQIREKLIQMSLLQIDIEDLQEGSDHYNLDSLNKITIKSLIRDLEMLLCESD